MSYGSVDGLEGEAQSAHNQDSLDLNRVNRTQNNNKTGVCEDCGEAIAEKRLRLVSHAKYCIECQTEHDSDPSKVTYKNPYVP
jgi:RNA polymerase-binding transcription factor DksA